MAACTTNEYGSFVIVAGIEIWIRRKREIQKNRRNKKKKRKMVYNWN